MPHEFERQAEPTPGTDSSGLSHRWAVIVTGGAPLMPGAEAHVPRGSFVIAADSGLDHAIAAGLRPDLVVGDLDSVSAAGIAWARERNIPIEVYPTDKDLTDTQIALGAAWQRQLLNILLLSGGGDRLDHSISALTALGHPSLGACREIGALWGTARVHVLHAPGYWEFDIANGTTFSLLALHGECERVTVSGATWPLRDAQIEPGSSLCISNVVDAAADHDGSEHGGPEQGGVGLRVSVGAGVLTLIIPTFLTGENS